jgi:RNA polymerase sigma factor (sigma-70 family)
LLIILTRAEIIERLKEDSGEVFAKLYAEFLPKVFRYVNYRVTDISLAEDLTSTVFEKALTKFKTYNSNKAKFSTWIFTITRNTLIDHFRVSHKERTSTLEDATGQFDCISPEEESDRTEEKMILQSCLAELSQPEQEIISLKFGAEMTNRQIAKMLSLSESNVGIIIYRAVRKLRDGFKVRQNG